MLSTVDYFLISLSLLATIPGVMGQEIDTSTVPLPARLILIAFLLTCSAMFSGLTLGLLSLDKIGLQIVMSGDDKKNAEYARKIVPIREDGNLLLCTLLFGNVSVNTMLSILMADMTSGLVGFTISTLLIVIFGEIAPQAACARHSLWVGSRCVHIVQFLEFLFYPVAKPLSVLLTKVLGEDIGTIHTQSELMGLMKIHIDAGAMDVESGALMTGALKFVDMKVSEVMGPSEAIFMLNMDQLLNFATMAEIFKTGYSRIPIYEKDRNDVIGILFTKDLIFIDPDDQTSIRTFMQLFGRPVQFLWPDQTLKETLKLFREGMSHMGLVRDCNQSGEGDPFYEITGVITLDDIIQEILGGKILDEKDTFAQPGRVSVDHRNFDFARLRLLDAKLSAEQLGHEEARAITSHLLTNVPQFQAKIFNQNTRCLTKEEIQAIVSETAVIDLKKAHNQKDDHLYKRGKVSDVCTIVLTGKIIVLAGKDEFRSEAGPWAVIGADAILVPQGAYLPDFSAQVGSDHVRVIRITRSMIEDVVGDAAVSSKANKRGRTRRRKQRQQDDDDDAGNQHGSDVLDGEQRRHKLSSGVQQIDLALELSDNEAIRDEFTRNAKAIQMIKSAHPVTLNRHEDNDDDDDGGYEGKLVINKRSDD